MKPNLAILLLLLPLTAELSAKETEQPGTRHHPQVKNESNSPATILSAQVKDIANTPAMSLKSRAKLISNAVQTAVVAAIEGIKDPSERLNIALELVAIAAKAAPDFSATITHTVAGIPAIAKIEGAIEKIQAAVKSGRDESEDTDVARPERNHEHKHDHEFGGPDKGEHVVSPSH